MYSVASVSVRPSRVVRAANGADLRSPASVAGEYMWRACQCGRCLGETISCGPWPGSTDQVVRRKPTLVVA